MQELSAAMREYATVMRSYVALVERRDAVARQEEFKSGIPAPKAPKPNGRVEHVAICLENNKVVKSATLVGLLSAMQISIGGTATKALKEGKKVKSKKTGLHWTKIK